MTFEEMVVAIIAIIGGLGVTVFIFWSIVNLIKTWINRKNKADIDPQFFKDLNKFKRDTQRRIANLEAIISDSEEKKFFNRENKEQKDMGEIEIEGEDVRSSENSGNKDEENSNLRNMLNE